jgi:hypothetical protein
MKRGKRDGVVDRVVVGDLGARAPAEGYGWPRGH